VAKIEPAVIHYLCMECNTTFDVVVPIQADFYRAETGEWMFRCRIDPDAPIAQPFWDHRLLMHGPRFDDGD
jgi:hypothetical protein